MLHCFGILIKGKRKICDRSERDDFNLVGIRFDCFNKIINRALILCCPRRMNQVVIAHTVLAVDTECFSLFPGVCFARSLINRRVTSRDFKRHQRVIDRLLKINVARGNRHAEYVNIFCLSRNDHGNRIVTGCVGIDDDFAFFF